ncbi:DUF1700 domain-containing protein [Paraburkholderia sp. BCC1885]|uniref:DUF1700 domain-containing protein n=1 Tax=Paraburkholderia sp. BCC1885 TaxID=2562669 RepID=UPI0011826F08|nr:DUF1700 domain-containing protein [Paraburkholderia sp. BCC1885]
MKQDVFIETLQRELSSLPKQAVDEIIADYREYIGDALAAGRREEEVIAALGDPVKLARELKAQANYRQWQDRRSFGNLIRVIMSISGLGLLNVLLLVPFMLYLVILTAGYAVSVALTIAGLVGVVALSGHHFFGKPGHGPVSFNLLGSSIGQQAKAVTGGASDAKEASDSSDSDDETPGNLKSLKIVGGRFVFTLQDDSRLELVTRAGAIEIRKDGDNVRFESSSEEARHLLTRDADGQWSIARDDVQTLELKDDDEKVSFVRSSSDPKSGVWDISSDDGDNVKLEQDEHGKTDHVTAQSGQNTVDIGDGKIAINDGHDVIRVAASDSEYTYAIVMLPIGLIGLALCIWLTRITWRVVTRYVKRQIDVVSASLERQQTS